MIRELPYLDRAVLILLLDIGCYNLHSLRMNGLPENLSLSIATSHFFHLNGFFLLHKHWSNIHLSNIGISDHFDCLFTISCYEKAVNYEFTQSLIFYNLVTICLHNFVTKSPDCLTISTTVQTFHFYQRD